MSWLTKDHNYVILRQHKEITLKGTIQEKTKIAYLGPEETFSHQVVDELFGDSAIYLPQDNFPSVIKLICDGKADRGVIPFFNPYEEHIRECQEELFKTDLIATNVHKIDIDLYLATNRLRLDEVKSIRSNEHVFKQCDVWLSQHLPEIRFDGRGSTAGAAEDIKKIPYAAAICSFKAAIKNDLDILAKSIQNTKNFTLFFVIQKADTIEEWEDYSFLCFKIKDAKEQKAILDILQKHRFRSSQKWDFPHPTGEYILFFLEFFGAYLDANVVSFIAEVKKYFPDCKLIGTFKESITRRMVEI
ncbi:MAG: prephenate dehydratase domain-containing protein [Candidatus Omnitrophica bacterium]|nr:prephenate dehydratase domain-containing protein [Candidatus Omnitrophota bacterium]MDD5592262.1 prephenate dehydratase domain-containing protein [Candidatus Omnitrophota bacterium]